MEKILTFVKQTYESSKQKIMSYDDKNVTEKKYSNNIIIKAKSESNLDELKQQKNNSQHLTEREQAWGWFVDPEELMEIKYYTRRNLVFTYDSMYDIPSKKKD